MPGKHDPEKKFVSFSLKREMLYMIDQQAETLGVDRTQYVLDLVRADLKAKGVKLSPANRERVDAEVRAERKRRSASWSGYEARVAKLRGPDAGKSGKAKAEEKSKPKTPKAKRGGGADGKAGARR